MRNLRELTGFNKSNATLNYSYDDNGNRLQKTTQTTSSFVTDYGYDVASNRLLNTTTTGSPTLAVSYDAAGNTLDDGKNTYLYNARGRLIQVSNAAGTAQYRINGLGQRLRKITASGETRFVYDEAGHLLGEYTNAGVPIQETLYLYDTPVAVVKSGVVSYIYTDHLNAPRTIVNAAGTNIWQWNADPFGVSLADSDPDGDGVQFVYNLRFPGQYYDAETGLHYNYFRDYSPSGGRYIQSDPIGLRGGLNTYGYARNNPLRFIDPTGHVAVVDDAIIIGGGAAAVTACIATNCGQDIVDTAKKVADAVSDAMHDALDNIYEMSKGKGERGHTGKADGTDNPGKHWKDDPGNPGWGWEKDTQTGKKTYKKRPPYIPPKCP